MAKFDLGAFAQTLQSVPNSGTGAERIEYIPLGRAARRRAQFLRALRASRISPPTSSSAV